MEDALRVLRDGHNVVLYSAAGPADRLPLGGAQEQLSLRQFLGEQAGRILRAIVDASVVWRVLIAGGVTSSHAVQQLGIDALTFVCPLTPGAPLCRAWSRDGLEMVLKGGQMGPEDFFTTVLRCGPRTKLPTI